MSRCDIQQVCSLGIPASSTPPLGDAQVGAAELADVGLLDAAAELVDEQLHAVADAQHRHAELEQPPLERRRTVGVHRGGTAREDDPARLARRAPARAPTWCGISSLNTPQSRTRRAISCEYWPP